MASAFDTNVEIQKFASKNFSLWKEMVQDVLIIRRGIEAIWHKNKPASMTTNKWRSLDDIVRSTILMHLAKNVYFNMANETTTFSLWEKL